MWLLFIGFSYEVRYLNKLLFIEFCDHIYRLLMLDNIVQNTKTNYNIYNKFEQDEYNQKRKFKPW